MKMVEDKLYFENGTCCHICNKACGRKQIKVCYHCQRTGQFRGAAHDRCNVNYLFLKCVSCFYISKMI